MRFLREGFGQRRVVGIDDGDQIHLKLEVAGVVAAKADGCLHIRRGEFEPAHADCVLQCAAKAGSISRGKELFGIHATRLISAESGWQHCVKIDQAVFDADMSVSSACCIGCGFIINIDKAPPCLI